MVKAYILIEMQAGRTTGLVESLAGSTFVRSIDRVTGPYDAIAVIEAQSIEEISDVVAEEIHTLPGVVRTMTSITVG